MTDYQKSVQFGGQGGGAWDDIPYMKGKISQLTIRHGKYVDAIDVVYGTTKAPQHGGNGGGADTISLANDENIIAVTGRSGIYLDQIQIVTMDANKKIRQYGPYGGNGGGAFYVIGDIQGFFGRSGSYVDALGMYVSNNSPIIQG